MEHSEMKLSDILKKMDKNSLEDQDIDSDELDLQKRRYENERYRDDTKSRRYLAYWAATVVTVYLLLVFVILFMNTTCLHLSDPVMIALLGTTTVNVLGLMYIVLKGYFKIGN